MACDGPRFGPVEGEQSRDEHRLRLRLADERVENHRRELKEEFLPEPQGPRRIRGQLEKHLSPASGLSELLRERMEGASTNSPAIQIQLQAAPP